MWLTESLKLSILYDVINPVIQRYELVKWLVSGKNTITPHLVKQQLVKKYAGKYSLSTFVETGTYLGVMIEAVKSVFRRIHSIELDRKLASRAKRKFAKDSKVTILQGDSSKLLPGVLKKLDEPCLFWLDAHYSEGITTKGRMNTPILQELTSILDQKINHFILIDDVNLFNGKKGYPRLSKVRDLVMKKRPKHLFKIENNVIVISLLTS